MQFYIGELLEPNWRHAEFEDVSSLVDFACDIQRGGCLESRMKANETLLMEGAQRNSPEWYNDYDRDRLLASMDACPTHIMDEVARIKRELEDSIEAPTRTRRRLRRNQDDGEELDPEAWAARKANGWTKLDKKHVPKHVLSIGVSLTVTCYDRPAALLYRGAAAAALADILTSMGHGVEVTAHFCAANIETRTGLGCMVSTRVKRSDAPLDIGTLAFCLSEIAFARIVGVTSLERLCDYPVTPGSGVCVPTPRSYIDSMDAILEYGVNNYQTALEVIKVQLGKITKEIGQTPVV